MGFEKPIRRLVLPSDGFLENLLTRLTAPKRDAFGTKSAFGRDSIAKCSIKERTITIIKGKQCLTVNL